MNLTVEECQRRWRLLKNKFVRELKKMKEKKSGDPGPAYVHVGRITKGDCKA